MGLFDFLSSETDQKNEFKPTNYGDTKYYNPNAFQYGGHEGGADQAAAGYGLMGRQAQGREGVGINAVDATQARYAQNQAAGLMMARANGTMPSIAGMQAQQDMNRAVAAQASAAAGARGPAALALAQQNAAANTANVQSAISGQAQINTANERLQAEQAAMGAYTGMRGMDEQRALANAQLMDQQRARNDAFQMGMTQNEMAVRQQQLQAQMAQQGLLAGSQAQGQQIQSGVDAANARTNQQNFWGTLGFVRDTIGGGSDVSKGSGGGNTSDARAKMGAYPMGGGMLSDVTSKVGLAQLGGPNQVNMGGAAPASFDATSGGGMDPMGSLRAHSNFATQYQRDPSGGMMGGGLMLSDDRAKLRDHERQAYLLGRAHGMERNQDFAYGGAPRANEEIVDRDPWQAESRRNEVPAEWLSQYMDRNGSRDAGTHYAAQPAMAGSAGDQMTGQLARGLAPYAYEYKPGFGTPGQKVGPMAQDMASNDVTATAVRQDPQSGLMSIDRDDGLKVALGGVGHLAAKQAANEEKIAALEGMLAQRQQGEGPITDLSYLAHARRQRRGF